MTLDIFGSRSFVDNKNSKSFYIPTIRKSHGSIYHAGAEGMESMAVRPAAA